MDEHAEEGGRRMLPFSSQRFAADAPDINQIMGAGYGVESGGVDGDVGFIVALDSSQTLLGYANERRLADINEMHIVAVIGLQILRLQRQTLHAKAVIPGN